MDANSWTAKYHGNYGNYTINITLGKDMKAEKFSCSCPSSGHPCKHIGFVVDEIKNQKPKIEQTNLENKMRVEEILEYIPLANLRQFIVSKAMYDNEFSKDFYEKFSVYIQNNSSDEETEYDKDDYSGMIWNDFEDVDVDIDFDDYYDRYYDYPEIDLSFLGDWYKDAKNQEAQGNYENAETICKLCIEIYHQWGSEQNFEYDLDSCVGDNYQDDFFGLLTTLASEKKINTKLLYEYCKTEAEKNIYNWHIKSYFYNLMVSCVDTENLDDFIDYQMTFFNNLDDKTSHGAEKIILRLHKCYLANNMQDEALMLLKNNIQIPKIREMLSEKHIEDNNFADAQTLINDYLADKKNSFQEKWKKLQLTIAMKENNIEEVRNISLQFLQNNFDKEYFNIYKSVFASDEWQDAFEAIFKYYDTYRKEFWLYHKGSEFNYSSNIPKLLIAENLIERLLEYLEDKFIIEVVTEYSEYFENLFPAKTLALYRKSIEYYAEKQISRNAYEYVSKILKKMQTIEGGNVVVASIVENFKIIYKRRSAMMSILKEKFY